MLHRSEYGPLKCFDGIFLKGINPPSCSRLYGVEPIGFGTPFVESLTSYIVRVASAHCVTAGTLVAEEVAPVIGKPYLTVKTSATVSSPFLLTARSINGFGVTASEWAN